ncbi:MAG: GC-type dockerin domain-anchored protein [Phycisphaerales bacterium]
MNTPRLARLASPLALALLAGAGAPAFADVTSQVTLTNKASYKLYGSGGNATVDVPFPTGGYAYKLLLSGTLHRNTQGTFPREACILIRRLTHLAPNISVITDEFIAQPFTQTTFDANGDAVVTDALVLPVPESLNFNGHFDPCSMNEPGHYELTFFEQFDDNAADNGPTPDATWTNLTIKFDDSQPSLATAPALSGTVGTTTRYGVRSNDTIGHPGQFTGSFIDPLAQPANATRIRHVRVTGYVSMLATSVMGEQAGPNEASQVRLRLQRYESVLLSPNDLQPWVDTEDMTVSVPTIGSTGYVSIDIPVAENDDWGKLTRNVPQGGPNASYYGIKYWATAYESVDHSYWSTDNIWNGLKIELFSDSQPSPAIDLGVLDANPNGSASTRIAPGTIEAGKPLWYRFELPVAVSNAAGTYLDIDTESTVPAFDTMIALYSGNAGTAGNRLAFDDDEGSGSFSQLSFGQVGPRPAFGDSHVRDGRDGALGAGVYYVAVMPYDSVTASTAFGATGFNAVNTDTTAHNVTLNLRYNFPLGCGAADVGQQGGVLGADGYLDNNDFIAFINMFFNQAPGADLGIQGGQPGQDGHWDNNDFIAFISLFFAGC